MKKSKTKILGGIKGKIKAAAHHSARVTKSSGGSRGKGKALFNLKGFKDASREMEE